MTRRRYVAFKRETREYRRCHWCHGGDGFGVVLYEYFDADELTEITNKFGVDLNPVCDQCVKEMLE